jgi:hypothetical protein
MKLSAVMIVPLGRRPWVKSITDLSSVTTVGLGLANGVGGRGDHRDSVADASRDIEERRRFRWASRQGEPNRQHDGEQGHKPPRP